MRQFNKKVICTLTLIFFIFQNNLFSSEANVDKLVDKTDEIIKIIKKKIEDEKRHDLFVLADMLKTYSQGGKKVWEKNILSFSQEMKEYKVIRLLDNKGKEIVKVSSGVVSETLKDESSRDYFKTTIKSKVGQVYISPIFISEFTLKPTIVLSTPLANLGNINKAILEFDWDFDEIINYVNNIKVGPSGNVHIISTDGMFLTHNDKSKILKENINKLNTQGFESIFNKIRNLEKGWGEYIFNNTPYIISYSPFQEMGWIIVVIIPKNELEQSINNMDLSQSSNVQADTKNENFAQTTFENSSVSVNSLIETETIQTHGLSSTTRKLLDGSLRNKLIDSYRATLIFTTRIKEDNFFSFKVNLLAKECAQSDYVTFMQKNNNKILSLSAMNENIYRKIKFEYTSPGFLQKNKIVNQNLVIISLPLKNEAIRMNRNEFVEFESLFNSKEKRYLELYENMELNKFASDRFDIKIDAEGTIYAIELKLKKSILIENELVKKIKLWVRGDYFLPVKYEWLNEKDETIVSIIYENIEINSNIDDTEFTFNPQQDTLIKEYQEIRKTLLENTQAANLTQKTSVTNLQFSSIELENILQEETSRRTKIIAEILALASLDFIETRDYNKLIKSIDIVLKDSNIMYVMILAENGERVIFKSQNEFGGMNADNPENSKIKELSHPIMIGERIIGSVRIGFTLNYIDKFLKSKAIDTTKINRN